MKKEQRTKLKNDLKRLKQWNRSSRNEIRNSVVGWSSWLYPAEEIIVESAHCFVFFFLLNPPTPPSPSLLASYFTNKVGWTRAARVCVYLLVAALHLDFCRFPWTNCSYSYQRPILLSRPRTWLEQIGPFFPGSLIFPSLNGQLHSVVIKRAVHATIVKFSVDPAISLTLLHFSVPLYRLKCPQKSYLCSS